MRDPIGSMMGVFGAALALVGVALVGFLFWYEWRYPCTRYENYLCSRTYCAMETVVERNGHRSTSCSAWATVPDTCTRCLDRRDRYAALPAEKP